MEVGQGQNRGCSAREKIKATFLESTYQNYQFNNVNIIVSEECRLLGCGAVKIL
jgi:hypothetical protein